MSVVVQNPWTTKVSSGLSFSAILRSKESAVKEPETSNHNKTSPPQAGASVSNTDTQSSNVARDGDAAPLGKKHNNNGGKSTKPGPDSKSVAHEKSENNKAATQNPSTQATLTKPTDAVAKSKHRTATPSTQVTSDLFVEKSDAGVPPSPRASCTYHKQSELIAFDFEPLKIAGPSAGTYTFGNISASSDVTATSAPHMKSQEGGAKPVQKRAGQNFTTPDARNTLNNTAHEVAHNVYGNVAVSNVGQTLPQLDGAAAPGEVPTETGMVSHYTPYDVPMYNTNEYHAHAPVPVPIPGSHVGTGMDYNTSLGNPQQHIPAPGAGLGHNMQHVTTQPPSSNASSNSTTPSAHTTTNLAYHPNNGLPPTGSTGAPLRTRGPGTNPSQSTRAPHASSYAPRYVPPHGAFPMPPHANQWPGYGYPPMGAMPGQGGHPVPTSATIPSGPSSGQTSRTGPGHTMPMGGRGIFTRGAPMPPYYPPYDYGMSSYSGHPNHHHLASNTPAGPPLQSGAYGIPPGYPGPYYGHPSGPQGSGSGNRYGAPMNNRYASGNQGMMDPNSGQY